MLIMQKCRFVCCPKTGSKFSTSALVRATPYSVLHEGSARKYHTRVDEGPGLDLPSFGFVRHPVTWYESYWRYRMQTGWTENHPTDRDCKSDDLNEFVGGVVEKYPGWMSRYFQQWLGEDYQGLAFIGRFESLLDDLCLALRHFEQPFDEEKLRNTEARNVGDRELYPATLDPSLGERIIESESRIVSRFYAGDH